jgi:CTP synthase
MVWLVAILSLLTLTQAHVPLSTALTLPTIRGGAVSGSGSGNTPEDTLAVLVQECIDSNRKLVVVTGGVLSGIGKGVTASSIGVLFRAMGLRVTALKIDPYLNVDAGTMSPLEHGEVFVLDDGGETDLDLGNYERFLSVCLTSKSNLSTGKIYQSVIERERKGDYLGKTVQVVPHVSDAIQEWVLQVAQTPVTSFSTTTPRSVNMQRPEICIIELGKIGQPNKNSSSLLFYKPIVLTFFLNRTQLGGTLGDIESMPFVEALRQLQENIGYKNMCFVHVSLVPVLGSPVPEQKTKPTQHSVQRMMQLGLRPDFLCCRGKLPLEESVTKKLSLFTSVPPQAIISLHDVSNIYRVPLMMMEQNLPTMLVQRLRIPGYYKRGVDYNTISKDTSGLAKSKVIKEWTQLSNAVDEPESECTVALVAKYMDQGDAYLSVIKALTHSAIATKQRLKIEVIDSSDLEQEDGIALQKLLECDGMIVPGGFGERGFEGKIKAIQIAREMKMPFLGICLGMQGAVVEYARNVAHIPGANSAEFKEDLMKDLEDVVIFMPEGDRERMGGTMRLGARETFLKKDSLARKLYGHERIMERHRHRYEVNPAIVDKLEEAGLHFVGKNTDHSGERMEVVELPEHVHPYFVGAQFHPEFTSRPEKPNPLFLGLLQHIKSQKAASTSQ